MRPTTRSEGYAIQALVEGRSPAPLFGWKIAATSVAGQKHINVDGPLAGRLLREKAFASEAELPLGANHMRVAEPEFAFRMAQDLPPRESAVFGRGSRGGDRDSASGDRVAGLPATRTSLPSAPRS